MNTPHQRRSDTARPYEIRTLVHWNQSQAEFEADRREAAREIPWIVVRFGLVIGLALWGFQIAMRRYAPGELPLNWVMAGAGLYALLGLIFMLLLPRWPRRVGEYRLTTRGIVQPQRRRFQRARWSWLTGFYVERDGRSVMLLGSRKARYRIELPGDQRDDIILRELRERLPETPNVPRA